MAEKRLKETDIEKLWEEHEAKLNLFIRSRVANSCNAKDILHQVFLKAKTNYSSLRNSEKAVSWIYQMTRNAVVDYYRSRKKTDELPEDLPEIKNEKNPWALISRCVKPFIEELPEIYREALLLSEIAGLKHAEVAKRLKISLPSAKARIQRGRQRLKKKFEDCCIFECSPHGAEIHSDTFGKEC